ncbi:4-hydroxy-tetrahydrodipicolinate synthase [Bacillus horti]|uniref:4-hydroxy-tetrahydrodipicolinate synthase n=2 Tax=Caldalkalibacillus horti TaxID=77523 RepID=A0ABT9W549_9BACI|nr:4-hydroxy-tetrahydrodipicolinate synthase [Bacillus horti]
MDKHSVEWKGYLPAISTPFLENGEVDWSGWRSLLEWLVEEGMHGLVLNGTTGEWFSQSLEEKKEIFKVAAEVVEGRIPLIGGCTAYTALEVAEQAAAAKAVGLDGILVAPSPYIVPTDDELVAFYENVSELVELPICIYNWPRGANLDMSAELVSRLADIEKVVAIKNSTPSLQNFVSTFFAVKDKLRYFGFPMNELGLTLIKEYGGDGTMGAGAVLGRVHPNFYNFIWQGDVEQALQCGRKDQFLFQSWFNQDFSAKYGSPQAIVKTALNLRGLPGGYPRLPILPLTTEQQLKVKETLEQVEQVEYQ